MAWLARSVTRELTRTKSFATATIRGYVQRARVAACAGPLEMHVVLLGQGGRRPAMAALASHPKITKVIA